MEDELKHLGVTIAIAMAPIATGAEAQEPQMTQQEVICSVIYSKTSQGTEIRFVKSVMNDRTYLVLLMNPAWQSLQGPLVSLTMTFTSLPHPDGNGGFVRHPAHDPLKMRGMIMTQEFGTPTLGLLFDGEVIEHLASTSEGSLHWTINWQQRPLTDVMLFSRYMLNHLNRCIDPFSE